MGNSVSSETEELKKKINEARETHLDKVLKERSHAKTSLDTDCHFHGDSDAAKQETHINLMKYEFPFENLVFEGGGNKGMAYCGSVKALEDAGILKGIKRIAGTSIGSIFASMVAVGYTADELRESYKVDLTEYVYDVWGGYWSIIPNIWRAFGWNPGNKVYDWLGELLEKKTGNPDITFSELYKFYGKELCIIVTNVNHMREIYCHPKTTPDVPIRLATRLSMSIPGLFQAKSLTLYGETNTFVDGGVICNYPIQCFDGWWLSFKKGDSFVERLRPLKDISKLCSPSERFGGFNDKTLGFVVFSDSEMDLYRYTLDTRYGQHSPLHWPDSSLARQRKEEDETLNILEKEHQSVERAVDAFLEVLSKNNIDGNHIISRTELEIALQEEQFPQEHLSVLFGDDVTTEDILKVLDKNGDGEIHYMELLSFIEEAGVSIQQRFLGFHRTPIDSLLSFVGGIYSAITYNLSRVFVQEKDLERTVGINTGHIETGDFKLEEADRDFVIKRGESATNAFLRNYVRTRTLRTKSD